MSKLFVTSQQACLPNSDSLVPATIEVDLHTGKITNVDAHYTQPDKRDQNAQWVDTGDLVLLPGLVDSHVRCSYRLTFSPAHDIDFVYSSVLGPPQ